VGEPIRPWPVVRRAAGGHPVRTLQHLLNAGPAALVVDGDFGAKTEDAVRAAQRAHRLAVDGVVGARTWRAIIVRVALGDEGDAVRGVQEEFVFRPHGDPEHQLEVDGVCGPETEGRVRGFQQLVDLVNDGVVGPVTWQALVSGMLAD
jgi:peptidoglycan hydrolase-like protein with peptidoglycan-binding domain